MKLKASMILVLASLAIAVSLIAFWPERNLWQQYGVTYTDEVGPTGTYYTYEFTREYQGEIVRGPRIQGSTLKLRYKDASSAEFVVGWRIWQFSKIVI